MNRVYRDIEFRASNYILWNLGSNIRIKKIEKDINRWKVDLFITFPNSIRTIEGEEKTFIYKYELDKSIYFDENLRIDRENTVKAEEIEYEIIHKFWKTNQIIEKAVLKYGRLKWGKIDIIGTIMTKVKNIITKAKEEEYLSVDEVLELDLLKMVQLIEEIKYLRYDSLNPNIIVPTNALNRLFEKELSDENNITPAIEVVIGHLVAEKLDVLLNDFKYFVIKMYVDVTILYYVNAIRFGDLISMKEADLRQIFNGFRSSFRTTKRDCSFSRVLEELHIAGLLVKEGENIRGDKEIFNKLMKHEIQIPLEVSVHEMVTY